MLLRLKKHQIFQHLIAHKLNEQATKLSVDGWDEMAIISYQKQAKKMLRKAKPTTLINLLVALNQQFLATQSVGTDLYTKMLKESLCTPKEKSMLVIQEHMKGFIDEFHMLQLPKSGFQFDKDLAPHAYFFDVFAKIVQQIYVQNQEIPQTIGALMIHQFRMYIDRHNIAYIRENFHGKTDWEKLMVYKEQYGLISSSSRMHNKFKGKEGIKQQKNVKFLTPNFHGEFIINIATGAFVTQWDVLEANLDTGLINSEPAYYLGKETELNIDLASSNYGRGNGNIAFETILNTESYNYANANDDMHRKWDVKTARTQANGGLENDLKDRLKNAHWQHLDLANFRKIRVYDDAFDKLSTKQLPELNKIVQL